MTVSSAPDRSAWRFWNGHDWVTDWHAGIPVFDGAPQLTVHLNPYLHKYVAVYMVPLGSQMALRTADHPEGPWSDQQDFGDAQPSLDPNSWDYALVAHPEFEQQGGKIEYLSCFQPGTFLNGVVHLVRVVLR